MGSLIALDINGSASFVQSLTRIWEAGDAVLPLDLRAPRDYLDSILAQLKPSAIENSEGVRYSLGDGVPTDDDDALVIATSGTTGRPKGVVHSHRSMQAAAELTASATSTDATSHWLACLPLSHIGGFSVIPRALTAGAELTVHPDFRPARIDRALKQGATHVSLVPTALARIDPTPWQVILLGGSAIPSNRPANSIATYGMTETGGGVVYDGIALPGVDVRVGGDDLIEIRSPTLARGYRCVDPANQEYPTALTPLALTDDGFMRTTDLGSIDPTDGALTIHGRLDDLIITGGVKVWPEPVEQILRSHSLVSDCAVVGRNDPEWGQVVVAVVVAQDETTPPNLDELRELVKGRLPSPYAPKDLVLTDAIQRTVTGKLRRSELLD
ncbi:MAG: AMP-binding protein [Microthrixaceae bacterium]|nr:AMP-binding protein [Microthrixaceae bacterium]